MPKASILICILLIATVAFPQDANPPLHPKDPNAPVPTITFTQNWQDAFPPFYSIGIGATARGAYQSTPKPNNVGDPYYLKFVVSNETLTKLFDLSRQLNFFDGNWDFKKSKIAFTGTKTLHYKNGDQEHETSYNWSDNVQMQQITAIFQNISETIELGRKLEDTYRFDKLGVDAVLKRMEQAAKDNRLIELQTVQPILVRIAKDTSMMNISRRRAEFLLTKVPKDVQIVTQNTGQH
jgi:hypothetical protein